MKTLVVASGKGGTGKTTLSALFASFAARDKRLVVADCDVEASNLPLALRAVTTAREAFQGSEKAVVDEDLCAGCEDCLDRCRFEAISMLYGAATIDEWSCEGCGACATACPTGAMSMQPRQAGELLSGVCSTGSIVFGQLKPGQDLSGKLVSALRERARELAEEQKIELVLVDGPPGIGCPAIASLSGADGVLAVTEPSLSGAHDLLRLAELARQLRVPLRAALNKADLSLEGSERLRATCREEGIELLGEVPFDARLLSILEEGRLRITPGVMAARSIWDHLESWMSEWPDSPAINRAVV